MQTTKNELTKNEKIFFNGVSKYLESPLYFYGSIQRSDYIQGKSDIDVAIFTDNETSSINKLIHYLHITKYSFNKFAIEHHRNNKIIKGIKVFYNDPSGEFSTEFAIVNTTYKNLFLTYHEDKTILPFYISFCLIILKIFHYKLGILPHIYYTTLKNILMTEGLLLPRTKFLRLGKKYHK